MMTYWNIKIHITTGKETKKKWKDFVPGFCLTTREVKTMENRKGYTLDSLGTFYHSHWYECGEWSEIHQLSPAFIYVHKVSPVWRFILQMQSRFQIKTLSYPGCTSLVLITALCRLVADGREGLWRMDSSLPFSKLTVLRLVTKAIRIYTDMLWQTDHQQTWSMSGPLGGIK